jgi:hypothetical protein
MPAEPVLLESFLAKTASRSAASGRAEKAVAPRPVLLLSALPRSGANYLEALLLQHPRCRASRIPEDFFLANSAGLISFCDAVTGSWDDWWRQRLGGAARLAESVGEALLNFANSGAPREWDDESRLLLRSPSIDGIETARLLFPNAQLLILVRDGPETVESGHRSFGWWYDDAIRAWRKSVRRMLSFVDNAEPGCCRLVRFEDLVADPAREIAQILEFLELDNQWYPYERVDSLPVLGSSSHGRAKGEPVHWRPVAKTPEFDPLSRAKDWPLRRQKRFSWLAGAERVRLGYAAPPLSASDRVLNAAMDLFHAVRRAIVRVAMSWQFRPRLFSDRQWRYLRWRNLRTIT